MVWYKPHTTVRLAQSPYLRGKEGKGSNALQKGPGNKTQNSQQVPTVNPVWPI